MYDHEHENEIIPFAVTNYRGQNQKFGIKTDDRRRHVYILGKTGMGKTTLIENMVISDILAGHGVAYIDPHGDTAEKIIDFIPPSRINDVIYFNPSDVQFPIGFNILESVDEIHKPLIASGLMGVFKKIWPDVWSARMEHILNNCLLALLDYPGSTLLGINRLLVDVEFRRRVLSKLTDPLVQAFWIEEYAKWEMKFRTEAIQPIQNKVGQFLSSSVIRNIVAQVKSSFDVRKVMDEEKIFVVNLSKGRIGEENSRLLGGMLITKLQLTAMERVDIPEVDRKDFYMYVDEFQNFSNPSFANILSEARKYRLNLIIAHQFIEQLDEEYVRPAIFGNVGTIILFRVGAKDAEFLEQEFSPRFTPQDLVNLAKWDIYLKLMIDGVSSEPFSAKGLPPINARTNSAEKVIHVSHERYSQPREVIEEKVLRWTGAEELTAEKLETMQLEAPGQGQGKKKVMYDYTCTRCKKDMKLPVKLDTSRPIYCEDCLEEVRTGGDKGGSSPKPSVPNPKPKEEKRSNDSPSKDAPRHNDRPKPRDDRKFDRPKFDDRKPRPPRDAQVIKEVLPNAPVKEISLGDLKKKADEENDKKSKPDPKKSDDQSSQNIKPGETASFE